MQNQRNPLPLFLGNKKQIVLKKQGLSRLWLKLCKKLEFSFCVFLPLVCPEPQQTLDAKSLIMKLRTASW
jgi:hypothetical protein